MPELPEVERYRMLAAARALDRPIVSVEAPDAWFVKRGADADALKAALTGICFGAARRRGKLMLLDGTDSTLGLHFGMSGRLLVDGEVGVDDLLYAPRVTDPRYERFGVTFADGGRLVINDPRRLGGVELDPDEDRLGPDALGLSRAGLARALAGARVALKARLLDQSKVAGIGNLIADEILWRAGLDPRRPCHEMTSRAVGKLHTHLTSGLADLIERGGSHTGDLMPARRPGGLCPRDGAPLKRATVGGRTTFWCPRHQR